MLRSRIIPTLLLRNNGLVKTVRFDNSKYIGDPINAVKIFNEKEVDELAFFDIDATSRQTSPNFELLKHIATESRMPLCYGGGVKDAKTASNIINIGFEKVSISAAAVERPPLIREIADAIGSQSVCVTFDVKKNKIFPGYTIYTHNGKNKVKTPLVDACVEALELGAGEIIVNSIDRDGTSEGYDLDLANQIRSTVSCPITMLGGCGSLDHMQALIDSVGVVGAAAGSFFVFKGQYRAVLISYARPSRVR
ncbi:AglZ/HisF2 family acetamidino modification protein [Variovorax sp. Varisp41]|uniref:AglZ/HisF2 family acetamidino modification protein n=1 Tax=unclassified Variovorax TaxID=663243 RepID=UPI0039B381A7